MAVVETIWLSLRSISSADQPANSAAEAKRSTMVACTAMCWPRMPSMTAETSARCDV